MNADITKMLMPRPTLQDCPHPCSGTDVLRDWLTGVVITDSIDMFPCMGVAIIVWKDVIILAVIAALKFIFSVVFETSFLP